MLTFYQCGVRGVLDFILINGMRYPRWGGRRNAVRLEKCSGVEKGLKSRQTPQRRVHALLAGFNSA
jgi:hypothetical protein